MPRGIFILYCFIFLLLGNYLPMKFKMPSYLEYIIWYRYNQFCMKTVVLHISFTLEFPEV
jgi:hypothetical protein